jgi:hypothetical protein
MLKMTMAARIRRFEKYRRTRTPEDIRIEALEARDDERFLEQLDPNEPRLPVEDLWRALGLEHRAARSIDEHAKN